MTALGTFKQFAGRLFRFQLSKHGENAYLPWSPWGAAYAGNSIANAKLLVPVDQSLNEKVIILFDTGGGITELYTQKPAGYGVDFAASFNLIWTSTVTYINNTTLDAILNLKDISTLNGMSSTSAELEAKIAETALNTAILEDVTNAILTAAINDAHAIDTDTGTNSATFGINLDADGITEFLATIDTSNLTANVVIDLKLVDENLNQSTPGIAVQSKTKVQALALGANAGRTIFVNDIDGAKGFLMTFDGSDWTSGVYYMQQASNTIATSPTLGDVFVFLNNFWICIDATANKEVFKITRQKAVFVHTVNETIDVKETQGSIIHNFGAGGAITLTTPADSEVNGSHIIIMKLDSNDLTIQNSSAGTIVQNTSNETNAVVEIYRANGTWIVGPIKGSWV